MGGCCCCSSRSSDQNRTPAYYYCPRVSEEHQPLSAHQGATSAFSTGLLVDTNLDTSSPDTYRPPPAPMPYDTGPGHPQTAPDTQEFCTSKSNAAVQTRSCESVEEPLGSINLESTANHDGLKESNCKVEATFDASAKLPEVDVSKSAEPLVMSLVEEDVCPTCLEEYDMENPKIITNCEHHFHLACILEWMERSNTCPVCNKEMLFSPPLNE